jgi:hypothetical protein
MSENEELLYIYVAGPLTSGNTLVNVRQALDAGETLKAWGYAPFVPHGQVLWELVHGSDYEAWMEYDLHWLAICDALLRLPGDSPGADREVKFAVAHGIPVFHSIQELLDYDHAQ